MFSQEEIPMRKLLGVSIAVILCVIVAVIVVRARQDKSKRPSLPATAKCELAGGKSVTRDYSSPHMKGRKIYGDLVPFGKAWGTGANEPTPSPPTSHSALAPHPVSP